MDKTRFKELMENPELKLYPEEGKDWHFCWDWDGLLIHKDDSEFEACSCFGGNQIRKAVE